MEAILNDESIVGQFTEDSFVEYMRSEIVPMMKMLSEQNIGLLKSYQTYGRMVTEEQSLKDIIHKAGNPIIDRFKDYLVPWRTGNPTGRIIQRPMAENCIYVAFQMCQIALRRFLSGKECYSHLSRADTMEKN